VVKGFLPDPAYQTGAPPTVNVRSFLTSICSINDPLPVLNADPDGWHYERVYHLRADGPSNREVVLYLRVTGELPKLDRLTDYETFYLLTNVRAYITSLPHT
jgi:hypothetical protein